MPLDVGALQRGCRDANIVSGRQFCRAELERFRVLAASATPVTIGCTQEAPLFREVAAATSSDVSFANLRETAGWSTQASQAGAKMAALAAVAADVPYVQFESAGVLLLYGRDQQAIEAANLLKDHHAGYPP